MTDTSRTVSDLVTNLFQDSQAAGSITPQDLRDLIETCQTNVCRRCSRDMDS